ncbi:electron transfer complex subunit TmcD [Thermodesulfobacteriota bacterium]
MERSFKENRDWEPGEKQISLGDWNEKFGWVEEFQASPDGEKVSAIVNIDEGEFNICVNGDVYEKTFDKIWNLRFLPDGRTFAFVSEMGEWTVAVDGNPWEGRFGYLWNPLLSNDHSRIAVAVQQDMKYCMAVDGKVWDEMFETITNTAVSKDGTVTAAVVQVEGFKETEIKKFKQGCFTAALNGKTWDSRFVNLWDMSFSDDNQSLAAEVRTSLYDYTIAVDGTPWDARFSGVWKPEFLPGTKSVVAPCKSGSGWTLYKDGKPLWENSFTQCWQQQVSSDGKRIAAIVAPSFGKWTVAVDGEALPVTFESMVTDLTFSPDSKKIAALGKTGESWKIFTDNEVWSSAFDMAWKPVFSPDSKYIAARVEKNGKQTIVINNKIWPVQSDIVWNPVFSPEGDRVLIRSIEKDTYFRRVINVANLIM